MAQVFWDALKDTLAMTPWLLGIYIALEIFENKAESFIGEAISHKMGAAPLLGALFGCMPQCGFSVVATALYTQRLATIGTLLAVYLSTSDEAIPIILSQPDKAGLILPLILTKILIALVAGYMIDLFFRKTNKSTLIHIEAYARGKDDEHHDHSIVMDGEACCGHSTSSAAKKFSPKEIFLHPAIHTAKIFVFIFAISFLISTAVFLMGEEAFGKLFSGYDFFQPFIAALVGLIPNCAASVAITELYLKGAITYGSLIAGLCTSAGLGLLVLFREEKEKKEISKVLGLLLGISILAGTLIQFIGKP